MWLLPVTGLVSLVWFVIRVAPKPSRATYPCQRVAAPLASGFVLWLMGVIGSIVGFGKGRELLRKSRVEAAIVCFALAAIAAGVATVNMSWQRLWADPWTPVDGPLNPMGQGRGIHPGRVVWVHDPSATSWNGSTGYWWDDNNTDQAVVDDMLSKAVRWLTDEGTVSAAWDALFRHFNQTHGGLEVGYSPGEKIAIKPNLNTSSSANDADNDADTSPQVVLALIRQLVNEAGVPAADITVYDASRSIPDRIYDRCHSEFPDVQFVDEQGLNGRIRAQADTDAVVHYSDLSPALYSYLPTVVTQAAYVINLANLKKHGFAGVTLTGKNHFGSVANLAQQWTPSDLHPYVEQRPWANPRPMGSYNPIVDMIGHEHLGEKTVLFVIDGMYGNDTNNGEAPRKWTTLGDHWSSSILVSQDPVAIDSVGLDLLWAEWGLFDNSDNYLHEAALANNPPSGVFYDPTHDGDVQQLPSLGTHEHWDNAVDKRYSRNLGMGWGIELIRALPSPVKGRYVFYNRSVRGAIAPDKLALCPGGVGSFVNYTSYSRGINGIMIDIVQVPGTPTAADFEFKVGNDSSPDQWTPAPAPTSLALRHGAGVDGSDRVTIIWADNAIQMQWLQVTVKATAATGLPDPDVFYFGNAIGEAGNSATDAYVNATDELLARNNPRNFMNPATVTDQHDYNRDGKVNSTDEIIPRTHPTNVTNALQLIAP